MGEAAQDRKSSSNPHNLAKAPQQHKGEGTLGSQADPQENPHGSPLQGPKIRRYKAGHPLYNNQQRLDDDRRP